MNDRINIVDHKPNDILAACVTLAKRHSSAAFTFSDKKYLEDIQNYLANKFIFGAMLVSHDITERTNGAIKTEYDLENPGYVVMSPGDFHVRIPYFLTSAFPHGDLLNRICALGRSVKIGQDSIVCISGSSCYLGWNIPVADIDFCEYVSLGDTATTTGLLSVIRRDDSDVICYRLAIDPDNTWKRPWPRLVRAASSDFAKRVHDAILKSDSRQVTFIADFPPLGVLEASNRLLRIDAARSEAGESISSFTAQEAPIHGGDAWIPRSLTDPLEIGRYLVWLSTAIKKLLAESDKAPRSAVKAIRRAITASRLLTWGNDGNELRQLLKDGARLAALHDRCELFAALARNRDPSIDRFKNPLRQTIDSLRGHAPKNEKFYGCLTQMEEDAMREFSAHAIQVVSNVSTRIDRALGLA